MSAPHNHKEMERNEEDGFRLVERRRAPLSIEVDYQKYERFLEAADLSEEHKREFIAALWSIIVAFVDLGFGVHPAQQAEKTCGKLTDSPPKPALSKGNQVNCQSKSLTTNSNKAAGSETVPAAEGVET